jgi:arginyl-tRNA synthetase
VTPKTTPDAFVFPKCIYLDQFLFHNLELANNKREMEREINAEIRELTAHRETLTHFNVSITNFSLEKSSLTIIQNRDTIKDLRSTIHYYEHVANPGDDPVRKQAIERTATHLKDILIMITSKVEGKDCSASVTGAY